MSLRKTFRMLGPGLLWAGAAIGVSHLVQSTRAGADFGFIMIWILIFALATKYPFFEFGPRYATATGNSLITGYSRIGRWALILYVVLTISTMFTIQAAVTVVTGGLVAYIFGISLNNSMLCSIVLIVGMIFLITGRYALLDKLIKFIIILLAIYTVTAVIYALNKGYQPDPQFIRAFDPAKGAHLLFLFAFIGWMPAPIDVSVWHSNWTIAKKEEIGFVPKMKTALMDFNIGYIGTAIMALGFLVLGSLLMYGSGEKLSPKGAEFAGQLISLYTESIGKWAFPVIAAAALTTMLSTTLTCMDAYPRILKTATEEMFPSIRRKGRSVFFIWLIVLVAGTIILITSLSGTMNFMVDLATTLSVVTAPALAILNYAVITHSHVPDDAKPKRGMRIYARICIVLLGILCLSYLGYKLCF
ncbi:MAG: divalent metal cation transporter [Bacteroidetes bacterium]|nr:divalent metal cation transporter [Bacteroidota bacterium]